MTLYTRKQVQGPGGGRQEQEEAAPGRRVQAQRAGQEPGGAEPGEGRPHRRHRRLRGIVETATMMSRMDECDG